MKQIKRVRFGAEDTGRFVLVFDKSKNNYATIELLVDGTVGLKLAPYIPLAAVIFMIPPGAIGYLDVYIDQKVPEQLVFDFQVVNCVNAFTTTATEDEICAATALAIPGTCSTECPAGSGTWKSSPCPNPIGSSPSCRAGGVYCV